MFRLAVLAALLVAVSVPARAADDKSPLARARQLYNMRDFDAAITAADEARRAPERADSADLIAARALLERYRANAAADDLVQARERLRRLAPERLADRERLEFIIGLVRPRRSSTRFSSRPMRRCWMGATWCSIGGPARWMKTRDRAASSSVRRCIRPFARACARSSDATPPVRRPRTG
jgi:hypothetical protein